MTDNLQEKQHSSLAEKIAALTLLSRDLQHGKQQTLSQIRALARTLENTGTLLGFSTLTKSANLVAQAHETDLLPLLAQLTAVLKSITGVPQTAENSGFNILIIDVSNQLTSLLRKSFQQCTSAYRIDAAASAQQAKNLLNKQVYDLILVDFFLPDKDSRELLREIKYELNTASPVYVLSSIEQARIRTEFLALGADKYIIKPIDPDALASTIDKYLIKMGKHELTLIPMGHELQTCSDNSLQTAHSTAITILLFEEDDQQAALMEKHLSKEGVTLQRVTNYQEALALLTQISPTVCLLKVSQPTADGFAILRHIRAENKFKTTAVIMMLEMGNENDIIRAYDLGADDYILKPFSTIQLVSRVKNMLKKSGLTLGVK